MISFNKKLIFIHIPKCGGTSMEKFILDNIDDKSIETKHFNIDMYKSTYQNINSYFKFCIIRNPYDRFLSLYNYFCKGSEIYKNKAVDSGVSISDFALNLAQGSPLKSGRAWPAHYRTQHSFIKDSCDLVLKIENINKDIEIIKKKFNCPQSYFPEVNVSKKSSVIELPDKVREIVNDIYDIDFRVFGYVKK
jgi:hypothetical protein